MNSVIVSASFGLAMALLSQASVAACAAPSVRVNTRPTLIALLEGNTVCVPAVTKDPMDWQELHQQGGGLVDYKRGPGHKTDPSEHVGTWSLSGVDGRGVFVTHDYGGGKSYTYSVWRNGDGTHSFCSANPEVKARVKTGSGAC